MRKHFLVLLFLFFTLHITAQNTVVDNEKKSLHQLLKTVTKEQIVELKNGVLLIRLHTKQNSIEALQKLGRNKLASQLQTLQCIENKVLVNAFKTKFNFCPTYFFFSNQSALIKQNTLSNVVFLNDSLQADTTIKLNNKVFYIAEITLIEQDTAKHFSQQILEPHTNWTLKRTNTYWGGPDVGFNALVVRNKDFIQQRRPFPYYTRLYGAYPTRKRIYKAVTHLNKKLHKFYKKKTD
jgi:hypothetical protein